MAIQSNPANSGLLRGHAPSDAEAVIHLPGIPFQVKVVALILLSAMLLVLGVMTAARTGTIPQIPDPLQPYLPSNPLPKLSKDAACVPSGYVYVSCRVHLNGQDMVLSYEPSSRMIVRTAIRARQYKIGDLIVKWGFPTGFNQYGNSIFIYWGTRSAVLYTHSFRPDSRVEFIQYDFDPQEASVWRGFGSSKHGEKSK